MGEPCEDPCKALLGATAGSIGSQNQTLLGLDLPNGAAKATAGGYPRGPSSSPSRAALPEEAPAPGVPELPHGVHRAPQPLEVREARVVGAAEAAADPRGDHLAPVRPRAQRGQRALHGLPVRKHLNAKHHSRRAENCLRTLRRRHLDCQRHRKRIGPHITRRHSVLEIAYYTCLETLQHSLVLCVHLKPSRKM